MPRDGSGVYTLPAGNPVVTGTIIASPWANSTLSDIAAQLNNVFTRDGLLGPTGPFKIVDGTVNAPGLAFNSEPGLGWYRPGASVISVASQGARIAALTAASATSTGLYLNPRAAGASVLQLANDVVGAANYNAVSIGAQSGALGAIINVTSVGSATLGPLTIVSPASVYVSHNFFALNTSAAQMGFTYDGDNGNYLHMLGGGSNWRWQADRTLGRLTWQRNGTAPNTVFSETGDLYTGRDLWVGTDPSMGLVNSQAGIRYLRFSSDNWRLQFDNATGKLSYYNFSSTELLSIRPEGSVWATNGNDHRFGGSVMIWQGTGGATYSVLTMNHVSGSARQYRMDQSANLEWINSENTVVTAKMDNSGGLLMYKGYYGRNGQAGAVSPTVQNLYWTGTGFRLWADSSDLGIINTTSDERVKKDIYPLEAARDSFMGIVPIRYHIADVGIWKDDGMERWGFSAQQLISTGFEKAVGGDVTAVQEDGTPQPASVDDRPILAQTVLMVQDLINRVTQLENA